MSLESSRKLGLIASLIQVILPIVAVVGIIALFISALAASVSRTTMGIPAAPIFGFSVGLVVFIIAVGGLALIGFTLFLVSMHRLSIYYSEPSIFKNVLYAFIMSIVSGVVFFVYEFVFGFWSFAGSQTGATPALPILSIFGVLGISLVFSIINAVLYMQAFNKLAEKSGMDNFKTAGLLYLIGVLTTILFFGSLLVWIAWIFAAQGFNKLKPAPIVTQNGSYFTPPLTSTTLRTKRCSNCGTENSADALYCTHCGKPLQ